MNELIRACFAGIWIESFEHADAISELSEMCRHEDWRLAVWDIDQGTPSRGRCCVTAAIDSESNDPLAAVRSLSALASTDTPSLLVLQNFHRFIGSAEIVQAISRAVNEGKQQRTFVVNSEPHCGSASRTREAVRIVVEHALPDRDQLARDCMAVLPRSQGSCRRVVNWMPFTGCCGRTVPVRGRRCVQFVASSRW